MTFVELFRNWKIISERGNFLPLERFSSFLGSRLMKHISAMVSRSCLRLFCFERFFLLQKEVSEQDADER